VKDKDILKRAVLDSDLLPSYKEARKQAWRGSTDELEAFLKHYGFDIFRTCANFEKSRRERAKRCRTKIEKTVLSDNCYFVTLTFTDEVLGKTSEATRRRYVARCLSSCSRTYVANIDYGDTTHREHYHALLEAEERPTLKEWKERYGFVKIQKVRNTEKDLVKVAKYTAKLSAHALKASTAKGGAVKAPRLIYSRKERNA